MFAQNDNNFAAICLAVSTLYVFHKTIVSAVCLNPLPLLTLAR